MPGRADIGFLIRVLAYLGNYRMRLDRLKKPVDIDFAPTPGKLDVFYGAELLEVIEDDRQAPSFKLLLGRLDNAGVKAKELTKLFGVDRKTMERWGGAPNERRS